MFLGKDLLEACRTQKWEMAREIIAENPRLIWTAKDPWEHSPITWVVNYGNLEMLQLIFDTIVSSRRSSTRTKTLKDVFEKPTSSGEKETPAHIAACNGSVECLDFLVKNCPSGAAILEARAWNGRTPADSAAFFGNIGALVFILKNAPSGANVLNIKSDSGLMPMNGAVKHYFTPEKIKEIGLEREKLIAPPCQKPIQST